MLRILGALVACGGPAGEAPPPAPETEPEALTEEAPAQQGEAPDPWSGVDLRVCGDGSGDFTDLQEAIDAAHRDEVIGACAGTYGPIRVSWGDEVVLVGVEGPDATRIEAPDGPVVEVEEGVLDLSGFTLTGAGIYDPWYPKGAITVFEGQLTLHDAVVEGCTGPFTLLFDEDELEVRDVVWRDNTSDWLWYLWQGDDDGPEPGGATLVRNVVTGGRHATIVETTKLHTLVMTNNVFAGVKLDTATTGFVLTSFGGGRLLVANNVFYDVDDLDPWGGRLFEGDADLRNNLVLECDAWDLAPIASSYSLYWNNGVDYAEAVSGVGNLFAEPLVTDPRDLDFRLEPGSPAIDAGDPAPEARDPDGTRNDIGAYGGPEAPAS